MKLTYFVTAAIASLTASTVLASPALQVSVDAGVYALSRPVPRMKYENLNHIVIRMTDAVETLDDAISNAIDSHKVQDSLAPAEKGLGLLAMYLADATEGLKNQSVKINNPEQVYGSLTKLKDAVKPVAEKTASLKIQLDQLEFTGIIVTVLQGLTVAFDGLYHALDARLDKNEVPDCIALPIMNAICTLDDAIYTLDSTAALTDKAFCTTPENNVCPSWQKLPKKLPGLEKAHWDIRIWLYLIYKQDCFHQKCKLTLVEAILITIWTYEPDWHCNKQVKQKRMLLD